SIEQMTRVKGLIPAAVTPFNSDLDIDFTAMVALHRRLLDQGCAAILSQGTTGEANSLSFTERLAVYDALGESGLGNKTMAGVGCCNLPETVALAKKAYDIGALGILVMPPFFYRAASDEGIYAYFCRVFDQIGGDLANVYIYDFPQMSGIDISLETILRLRDAYPGIIVGLKNSSGDFDEMKRQHAALDDFDLFPGTELYLLDGLREGFAGCISATFNVFAADAVKVWKTWQSDDADDLQKIVTAKRTATQASPMIPALKALLADSASSVIQDHIRPPLQNLNETEFKALKERLSKIG
ncbi:MAG: dihydrodipicolinate synthase family protein, partial [Fimbriimonadaceae bacterium]|nr:dihydrodipicolinate synthase family protein [Alphaproteobacteria bacterium]